MAINAIVASVRVFSSRSGVLELTGEERGQPRLHFPGSPEEVLLLHGMQIWGGADSIFLGERKIANRQGYTTIEFVNDEEFHAALAAYDGPGRRSIGPRPNRP